LLFVTWSQTDKVRDQATFVSTNEVIEMAFNSTFKTLKDLRVAKNLTGDDALAQQAVRIIETGLDLRRRAHEMGNTPGIMNSAQIIHFAATALGHLDSLHHYAFLDGSELSVDVRGIYNAVIARGLVMSDAGFVWFDNGLRKSQLGTVKDMLDMADADCSEVDANVPHPSVIAVVNGTRLIKRGIHAQNLINAMGTPANAA
jgi:hypothetical protein